MCMGREREKGVTHECFLFSGQNTLKPCIIEQLGETM